MKTDYPELEGKEITYHRSVDTADGIIVGVSYHVGITVVNKSDKSQILLCLNRKWGTNKAEYRKLFYFIVKQLKQGSYVVSNTMGISSNIPQSSCPFSQ